MKFMKMQIYPVLLKEINETLSWELILHTNDS